MRVLHKIYANLFGYFWLPCPVCQKMFGGHEITKILTEALVSEDGKSASCVCPDPKCSQIARESNAKTRGFYIERANHV